MQFGFGSHNVCEQIALLLQTKINRKPCGGEWILIQVDFRNAINAGKRAAIVKAVRTLPPHLLPLVCMSLQTNELLLGKAGFRARKTLNRVLI